MNTITTHTFAGVDILRLPGGRATLTGPAPHVAALLERIRQTGTLISASDPVPNGRPGHIMTTIRLLPPQQVLTARPVHTRRDLALIAGAMTLGILTCSAALTAALWLALSWLAAHLLPILGGTALTLVLAGLAGRRACTTIIRLTHWH